MDSTLTTEKKRKSNYDEDKVYFDKEEIDRFKKLIKDEYSQIRFLEEQINQHRTNIQKYSKTLVNNCKHNKIPDRCCYDRTTFYCDICNQDLW